MLLVLIIWIAGLGSIAVLLLYANYLIYKQNKNLKDVNRKIASDLRRQSKDYWGLYQQTKEYKNKCIQLESELKEKEHHQEILEGIYEVIDLHVSPNGNEKPVEFHR